MPSRWRRGRVARPRVGEYSVGPQTVKLDGSNYRGARGAAFSDLRKMAMKAKSEGATRINVATLIRRTSQTKGFRWVSRSGYNINRFISDLDDAFVRGVDEDEFAREVQMLDFPTEGAITWTIVGY